MSALAESSRITPFLWFDANAEEAVDFYLSIFPNSRKLNEFRSPVDTPSGPAGTLLTVSFELDSLRFIALNGGPGHPFTDAVSLMVGCENQQEIDYYWSRLTEGGTEVACGWLRDKFGLSWQVTPRNFPTLLRHPKAMQAMMKMKKLVIAELERAAQAV
jgi:predicted 3-demethylubiquinone-9 3-methyltransferase (glyoxalase superfamily)